VETTTSKFDLTLYMEVQQGQLIGVIEYNSDLFDAATARRMLMHLHALLGQSWPILTSAFSG
jgi:hypothetical protein